MINKHEIKPEQSIELLKELHILTRDGKLNQDSRRKLKQINHLYQFIEPLLLQLAKDNKSITMVDHGAGKSYLGFIIYDLFFKGYTGKSELFGIESRTDLVNKARSLADRLGFKNLKTFNLTVADSMKSDKIPACIDIVTALHACDTATDDAISFAIEKQAKYIVLIPCCQAEVAALLRQQKPSQLYNNTLAEIWRHPIHTREFGSHITNVLRCLQLESYGYKLNVTELVGWEHSMKNELIIATKINLTNNNAASKLKSLLNQLGLEQLETRFHTP